MFRAVGLCTRLPARGASSFGGASGLTGAGSGRGMGQLVRSWTRQMASQTQSALPRQAARRRATLRETVMKPSSGDTALTAGRGLVAGASVLGIGALCYYGAGLSDQMGAMDHAVAWPAYVRDRVRTSYMYFGGSLALTAGTAAAIFRSPTAMNLVTRNSMLAMGATFAAMIGSSMLVHSLPYTPGALLDSKRCAWALHCGVVGAVVAPLAVLGGPILMRAAWYTAGVVGGLSALAVTAPSDKFLNMGAPLTIGLGVVFCASVGSMFLPPHTALGGGLHSVMMYGGLVLFSMLLLYNTQKLIHRAETHSLYSHQAFDPINASIGIYMDTVNIFIRLAMLMAGGGSRKK